MDQKLSLLTLQLMASLRKCKDLISKSLKMQRPDRNETTVSSTQSSETNTEGPLASFWFLCQNQSSQNHSYQEEKSNQSFSYRWHGSLTPYRSPAASCHLFCQNSDPGKTVGVDERRQHLWQSALCWHVDFTHYPKSWNLDTLLTSSARARINRSPSPAPPHG